MSCVWVNDNPPIAEFTYKVIAVAFIKSRVIALPSERKSNEKLPHDRTRIQYLVTALATLSQEMGKQRLDCM